MFFFIVFKRFICFNNLQTNSTQEKSTNCNNNNIQIFTIPGGVYVSGVLAMISTISLAFFAILSVIQLAMITSRDTVVLKYKTCVILKLALSIIAGNLLHDKYIVELCNMCLTLSLWEINHLFFFLFCIALLALSAAILFAIEIDESNRSFIVSRGMSFYLQVFID